MKKQWKPLLLTLLLIALVGTLSFFAFANTNDTVEQDIKIEEFSLSLENAVYMNFKVSSDNISNKEDIELLVWDDAPTAYERASAQYILTSNGAEDETGYECYQYTNLAAKDMTKTVYACAYYYNGTDEIYSSPVKFSVAMYADMQKSVAIVDEGLVTLLDKMLAYGAEAQTYFNHNTDFLATDEVHMIKAVGGTLSDGFALGWYKEGSSVTITADPAEEGYTFSHWENSAGENVSEDEILTVTVSKVDTYTAIYEEETVDYFLYTELSDGTYSINANPEATLPAELIIPATYNGKSVTEIAANGFKNQKTIVSLVIPDVVTKIRNNAFEGCSNLTNINIPDGVTYIGGGAFEWCSNLSGSIVIPEGVTSIGNYTFRGCSKLTDIKLSNSVKSIGLYAFSDCSNLININIPDGLTDMGMGAFAGCSSIINITIPSGITSIQRETFRFCNSLASITIPNGVKSVDEQAFTNCTSLTSIEISNGVISLGESVFENCSSLTSIDIPNSVISIGKYAFKNCSSLIIINIPNSVTSIGNSAFFGCLSLTSIELPDSITIIDHSLFWACRGLTNVKIPNSVTSISANAFNGCSSLTSIEIPNSVTSIGVSAFSDCTSLTSIEIPDSVTSIGNYAFEQCFSLLSIEIPNSVTSIGGYAFRRCDILTDIRYTGTEEEWLAIENIANAYIPITATIHYNYVPEGV